MKLLKSAACHLASDGGNVKEMTVMGDAAMERFSDRGSIPLSSIEQISKVYSTECESPVL